MKTLVKVNVLAEEITMTKTTEKRTRDIGSKEYEQLAKAKKDFPRFTVKIKSPKAKENSNKGLSMNLMQRLIRVMSDSGTDENFEKLRGEFKGTNFHFSKPKAYFLSKYPNWREWLPQVGEQQEQSVTAVEDREQRWGFGK